nr:MAG TPA: hypothetical protein [Caudoviricetes sp.]
MYVGNCWKFLLVCHRRIICNTVSNEFGRRPIVGAKALMLLIYAPVIQTLDNFNLGLLRKNLDRSLLYRFHSRNVGVKIRHTITALMVCLPPGDFNLFEVSQIQIQPLDFGLGEQLVCDVDTPNFLILALALAAIHGFVVGLTLSTIKQHFSYLSLLMCVVVAYSYMSAAALFIATAMITITAVVYRTNSHGQS